MLRILFLLLFSIGLSTVLPAQTNKNIRNLQKQQQSLKKEIEGHEKMLRSTKKDVSSQLANLQVLSAQIEGQEKYVKGIHTEITALDGDIQVLEKELKRLEEELSDCKRKYQHAVMYMFSNRTGLSKWKFILSAKNFRVMYRRMRYMSEFSKYQEAQGKFIRKKEAEVQDKRAKLLGVKSEKKKLFDEGKAQSAKLQGQQQERQQVVNELQKKQKQLQSTIAQQRKKEAALNARIDKLIQEEIAAAERRRKAEQARQAKLKAQREKERAEAKRKQEAAKNTARSTKTKGSKTTAKGSKTTAKARSKTEKKAEPTYHFEENADHTLTRSFESSRGRLPMPITGSYAITTHFGTYNVSGLNGVQLDNKGINITGHAGAQARAVYRGEVTAVFPYSGMYNVIVRHGSYISVYCNLASISVRTGQKVEARQGLGAVAKDASGNCTLHFQLRKEATKLNPERWLGR